MGFQESCDVQFEQDGISFIGQTDIYELQTNTYDEIGALTWKHCRGNEMTEVYLSHLSKIG